jgi:A/G-specific adenine glycosylase
VRHGVAYVGRRDDGALAGGAAPDRGLLGGMLGWPGCDWRARRPTRPPRGAWRDAGAEVRHTFTHFHLRLRVMVADLPARTRPARGFFEPAHAFARRPAHRDAQGLGCGARPVRRNTARLSGRATRPMLQA